MRRPDKLDLEPLEAKRPVTTPQLLPRSVPKLPGPKPWVVHILFSLVLFGVVGTFLVDFPILRPWLAAGFGIYAVCLWRWPSLWLIAIPALLPAMDLSPWSGRFFFDEFDALVLLTAGVLALRDQGKGISAPFPFEAKLVLALLVFSYSCSTVVRFVALPQVTDQLFNNYYSPFNGLRVAKGLAWALLLLPPLRRAIATDRYARLRLCCGFVAGLSAVCLVGIYERWMFPGLWAVNTEYRITSTFFSMHTGDGSIDVWLAMTVPFIAALPMIKRQFILLAAGLLLVVFYTLFAMQSRAPVIAIAAGFVVAIPVLLVKSRWSRAATGAMLFACAAAVLTVTTALPIIVQSSFGQRFTRTAPDAQTRLTHWRNGLSLGDHTVLANIVGMGLGSFPLLHQLRSTNENRAAWYSLMATDSRPFLRVWSGNNIYISQSVPILPGHDYRVTIQARTPENAASLSVIWCELWLLTSKNCVGAGMPLKDSRNALITQTATIYSGETGSPKSLLGFQIAPPTRFTFLVNAARLRGVDIGGISVRDSSGKELIENGNFDQGMDHWFWEADSDLPWHLDGLYPSILLEQGWLGIVAFGSILMMTIFALVQRISENDPLLALFAAAVTGFVVNGVTVSAFDQPRLAMAFYLLCFTMLTGFRTTHFAKRTI